MYHTARNFNLHHLDQENCEKVEDFLNLYVKWCDSNHKEANKSYKKSS